MRRCYLVCYDIRDPKRLRKVHRLMKAYGEPWQYSVFYCTLKAIDRVRLETALRGPRRQRGRRPRLLNVPRRGRSGAGKRDGGDLNRLLRLISRG